MIARASGVTRDLRKDEPYLAYKDFDFKVICAKTGDCFSRYLVRMEEMLESIKIIHQAIENLPSGAVNVDVEGKEVLLRVNPEVAKLLKSHQNTYLQELEEILGRVVMVKGDPLLHQEKFDLA